MPNITCSRPQKRCSSLRLKISREAGRRPCNQRRIGRRLYRLKLAGVCPIKRRAKSRREATATLLRWV